MKFIVVYEKQEVVNGTTVYAEIEIPGLTGKVGSPTIKSVASLIENKIASSGAVQVDSIAVCYRKGEELVRLVLGNGDKVKIVPAPATSKVKKTRQEIRADVLKRKSEQAEEMKARLASIMSGASNVAEATPSASAPAKAQKKTASAK